MATSTNRSPSPILTRPNPNLKNSEINSTMRRSFSGNPFARPSLLTNPRSLNPTTPANSPADLGRRKSLGKEGGISARRYEEKENENTRAAARVRSPAKSTKNFMSPTISAASKFTPSPRKKVLAEKNESVRTSISFSNTDNIPSTKDPESDLKSQMGVDQNKLAAVQLNHVLEEDTCPRVPSNSALKENACFEVPSNSVLKENACIEVPSNSVLKENACIEVLSNSVLKEDASTELPPSLKSENPSHDLYDLAETVDCHKADTDPSLPPYDPTTNYLSPRPLFLRYRPNPRVEVFLNNQVLDFEDSLISEILPDTVTEEIQSCESLKESDDDSPLVEMEPNTEPPLVSEPIQQHTFEPKIACKPKFFTRSRSITLLLGFLIACLCMSVTDSPQIGSPVLDPSFYHSYDPFEAIEFAKANFDGVVRNFKQWSSNSISYLSKVIPRFSKVDELSLFQFCNTSSSLEDLLVVNDGYLNNDKLDENQEQINGLVNVKGEEGEIIIEPLVEEEQGEPIVEEVEPMIIQAQVALGTQQSDEESQVELRAVDLGTLQSDEESRAELRAVDLGTLQSDEESRAELREVDLSTQQSDDESHAKLREVALGTQQSDDESHHDVEDLKRIEDQTGADFMIVHEIEPKVEVVAATAEIVVGEFVKTDNFQGENDLSTPTEFESNLEEDLNSEISTEMVDPEENFSNPNVLLEHGVFILLLGLLGVLVLGSIFIIHMKQYSRASTNFVVDAVKPSSSKKIYEEEEVNESSTSCPSEMSSFQKSESYYSNRRRAVRETTSEAAFSHSEEMRNSKKNNNNYKRESLASSDFSMGSPSYGSFTTYERISKYHHGSGDEEIATPVRRSSRIRSKVVTSS